MAEVEHASLSAPAPSPSTTTWDGEESPGATGALRQFEAAWAASRPSARPEPRDFLPDSGGRSAALLAILRAELGLRRDDGDRTPVEAYRDRYPELDADGLVALIYEEFCLREEEGDAPVPVEYDERFPDLAGRLRRVFDIHDLVGSGGSAAFRATTTPEVPFPESGQTTGGFHLIEELGRGSFARVFLAEERQLADRPVALKVSRAGSREPQTLARLQHTHIVPVHSYRTDPATGLHLLCMPFFGRVTLERLLAEPGIPKACTGADVLAALDRLAPSGLDRTRAVAARSAFARLSFARAIAWWGARMAEALAHAHERGVLHRDIKPSNVLVTADGLPMLLDFNLARDPRAEADGAAMGGTLAYMAPEHLDALAEGHDDRVDARADLYGLGVLLFETLTGRRPFAVPKGASTVADVLRRAAEERRRARPSIRATHPEIPSGLEAVVLKCLAVDPSRRHPDASALAADLQAVADDAPLPFAREPIASRSVRWSRRNRWPLALLAIAAMAWVFLARAVVAARDDQRRTVALLSEWVEDGARFADLGRLDSAAVKYADAARLAAGVPDLARQPALVARRDRARAGLDEVQLAASFVSAADRIRARRPAGRDEIRATIRSIEAAISPLIAARFLAPGEESPAVLAGSRLRDRLRQGVEELLFRRSILDRELELVEPRRGFARREQGERFARDRGPWDALRVFVPGLTDRVEPPGPTEGAGSQASLLYGLLAEAQGRPAIASAWVRRAERLDPGRAGLSTTLARLSAGD